MIKILEIRELENNNYLHAEIEIENNGTTYLWRVGNVPKNVDAQAFLEENESVYWRLAEIRKDLPKIYVEYSKPIKASDFIVSTPKIKDDPDEAFLEAITESEKPHGEAKSIDLITRSQNKMIKELLLQITDLEKRVKKLEK